MALEAPVRENPEGAVGGRGSMGRGGKRLVCGLISRGRTKLAVSLTPSEGDKEGSLSRSILDGPEVEGRFSKVVGESLNQRHLSEASSISQHQGCLGMPAILSQCLGAPVGSVASANTAADFRQLWLPSQGHSVVGNPS